MNGRLVYVIGPSGSGKDSVLEYARTRLPAASEILFAQRFITREQQSAGERHMAVTASGFERILSRGGFALHWTANGLSYGIGREIGLWMALGFHVVVNGSREYLATARQCFPDAVVVHITAHADVIRRRLHLRNRESSAEIEARFHRSTTLACPTGDGMHTIINDGALADAGGQMLDILHSLRAAKPA